MNDTVYDLMYRGEFSKAEVELNKIEISIKKESLEYVDHQILRCRILSTKGQYKQALGIIDYLIPVINDTNPEITAKLLLERSYLHYYLGNLETSKMFLQKLNNVIVNLEENERSSEVIGTFYHLQALLFRQQGQLVEAIDSYEKSLTYRRKLMNKHHVIFTLNNLSVVYRNLGELGKASNLLEEAIKINESLQNIHALGVLQLNLGIIWARKNYINKSIRYMESSLNTKRTLNNDSEISDTLYYLILILLENQMTSKAKYYFTQLQEINSKNQLPRIALRSEVCRALFEKQNKTFQGQSKALSLFEHIVSGEIIDQSITTFCILNISEILFNELSAFQNPDSLKKLKNYLEQMLTLAKSQKSHSLLVQVYLLQSKVSLIELNYDKAKNLLIQALVISDEKGLKQVHTRLHSEYEYLLDNADNWRKIMAKVGSFRDRIEFSGIESSLKIAVSNQLETVDFHHEIAISLMIIHESGNVVYSRNFDEQIAINENLIASFLTAINNFMRDILTTEENIEEIRQQDHTILLINIQEFTICYIFQGSSYHARIKLQNALNDIKSSDLIIENKNLIVNRIDPSFVEDIDRIVEAIFLNY